MKNLKKLFCMLIALCMALSLFGGCGVIKDTITLSELVQANATKNLLETYDSILVTFSDSTTSYGYYVDSELGYYWSDAYTDDEGNTIGAYHEIVTETYQMGLDGEFPFACVYADGEIDTSWLACIMFTPDIMLAETLQETVENGDSIVYKTKITISELIDLGYAYNPELADDYYMTEYTVDAETKHLLSMTDTYYLADGSADRTSTCVVEYNATRPDGAKSLWEAREQADALCEVTIVMSPDEDETTKTSEILSGQALYLYWYGEYESAYLDRACTQILDSAIFVTEDITIYLK